MSVEDCLEGRVIRPGTNVEVNERRQLANKEAHYNVRYVRGGSLVKVDSWCMDVRCITIDNMTLCPSSGGA